MSRAGETQWLGGTHHRQVIDGAANCQPANVAAGKEERLDDIESVSAPGSHRPSQSPRRRPWRPGPRRPGPSPATNTRSMSARMAGPARAVLLRNCVAELLMLCRPDRGALHTDTNLARAFAGHHARAPTGESGRHSRRTEDNRWLDQPHHDLAAETRRDSSDCAACFRPDISM